MSVWNIDGERRDLKTIEDIIKFLRDTDDDLYRTDLMADDLEAALKRERDIINAESENRRLYGLQQHDEVLKLKAQLQTSDNTAAVLREALERVMKRMCDRCRAAESQEKNPVPCLYGCEVLNIAKAALEGGVS